MFLDSVGVIGKHIQRYHLLNYHNDYTTIS